MDLAHRNGRPPVTLSGAQRGAHRCPPATPDRSGSPSAKTHGRLGRESLVDLVDVDVLDLQTSLMVDSWSAESAVEREKL